MSIHSYINEVKGKGTILNILHDDIFHYQKIIVALTETHRIMGEIKGIIIL